MLELAEWSYPGDTSSVLMPAQEALVLVSRACHGIKEETEERLRRVVGDYYTNENLDAFHKSVTGWSFRPLRTEASVRARLELMIDKASWRTASNGPLWEIRRLREKLSEVEQFRARLVLAMQAWKPNPVEGRVRFGGGVLDLLQPYAPKQLQAQAKEILERLDSQLRDENIAQRSKDLDSRQTNVERLASDLKEGIRAELGYPAVQGVTGYKQLQFPEETPKNLGAPGVKEPATRSANHAVPPEEQGR